MISFCWGPNPLIAKAITHGGAKFRSCPSLYHRFSPLPFTFGLAVASLTCGKINTIISKRVCFLLEAPLEMAQLSRGNRQAETTACSSALPEVDNTLDLILRYQEIVHSENSVCPLATANR